MEEEGTSTGLAIAREGCGENPFYNRGHQGDYTSRSIRGPGVCPSPQDNDSLIQNVDTAHTKGLGDTLGTFHLHST
jgi:hypothetical protein